MKKKNIPLREEATNIKLIKGEIMVSSLRIAEIVGKEHSVVLKSIRQVFFDADIDERKFVSSYLSSRNRETTHYLLPEREFNLITSTYPIKQRLKLIDELLRCRKKLMEENTSSSTMPTMDSLKARLLVAEDVISVTKMIGKGIHYNGDVVDIATAAKLISGREQNVDVSRNMFYKILRLMGLLEKKNNRPTNLGMGKYLDYRVRGVTNRGYHPVVMVNSLDDLVKAMIEYLSGNKEVNMNLGDPFGIIAEVDLNRNT